MKKSKFAEKAASRHASIVIRSLSSEDVASVRTDPVGEEKVEDFEIDDPFPQPKTPKEASVEKLEKGHKPQTTD